MDIPVSERRKEITSLFENRDYDGLAKMGIRMVGPAGGLDCGNYVLHELGFHASGETINVVWRMPRDPSPHAGIVLYTVTGNPVVQQHGLYDGKKVRSKWGSAGPAFEHALEDIPLEFGDTAEFVVVDDNLKARLQQAMYSHVTGEQF